MTTAAELKAAFNTVTAIANCIMELGEVPSGHLYARVMDRMTLEYYNSIIETLKRAKLIRVEPSHLIVWIGPKLPKV